MKTLALLVLMIINQQVLASALTPIKESICPRSTECDFTQMENYNAEKLPLVQFNVSGESMSGRVQRISANYIVLDEVLRVDARVSPFAGLSVLANDRFDEFCSQAFGPEFFYGSVAPANSLIGCVRQTTPRK